jgi:hypothetical protein
MTVSPQGHTMPSPFPGMNPYFEQPGVWRGFHTSFLVKLMDRLSTAADPRYFVSVEESLYIEHQRPRRRELFAVADAAVTEGDAGGAVVTAPVTARVPMGAIKRKHRWLTVRDTASREVVTVIELLSPSNKAAGDDREQYLRKRLRILRSAAHLVEIDLLRGGERMPADDAPESDYRILVSRRPARPNAAVWPVGLRDPLPLVPIPLRTGEPELVADLKPLLDAVYDGATYRRRLYSSPPDPPLAPADADWARQFLPA